MKKLFLAVALLMTGFANAQNFEGTIKWSMKMDVSDPAVKAKMEAAQARAKDPANQERMKEMQKKMNDPAMKAMMQANPAMKAQMEKMMSGGDPASMMPSGFTIRIKGGNTLTTMEGGMMAGTEVLSSRATGKTYSLDRENKTYRVLASEGAGNVQHGPKPEVKVTKTTETAKILNYTCTKYIAEVADNGRTLIQNFWTTTDIKDFDFKSLAHQRMGSGGSMFHAEIPGVPLRMESQSPEGNMVMEVTEMKRESHDPTKFVVPGDFKEVRGMGR